MSVSHKAKERQARTREARLKRKENISFATITKQESVKNIFYRHYIHAVYLNDKVRAYHFANSIGIKTPNVFIQPSKDFTVPFRTVPLKSGHVLKPKSEVQSRGVYIIHEENRIYDMTQKKNLLSFTELKESASEMLKKGLVKQDNWILEEVIYFDKKTKELAWDIKFYCFYGKAVLALRTSRDGDLKRCWFNREGKRVDTGKYSDELYEAPPVSEALFQLAERISYQIPAAFYRIDFLETMDTVFLGEFTPLPSDSDAFSDKYDNILGLAFLDAQARLNRDLFAKKDFSEYRKFYEQTSSSKPHALGIKKYFLEGIRRISKPINHKEIREQMNQSFDDGDYSYALKKYDQIPTRKKALGDHLIALEAKWALNQETLANKSSPSYHIDLTDIPSSNKNSNSENLSCAKTLSSMQLYKESTPYWISFLSGAKNINLATTRKIITTLLHLSYEDQHASLRILDLIKEKMEEILDNHHTDFINYTYVLLKNHQFEICLNQTRKIESSQGFRKNLKLLSIKTAAAIALGWTPEEINQELIISIKGTDYSNSDIYKKAKSLLLKHRCSKNNLFDSSSVKIDHYAQHVKTDTLFVTFGNALADIDKKPFAYDLILQQGWDLVSVMPRKDSMYQGLSFDQFKELISALLQKNPSYSKVFFYGSSLGAYAAVYYSGSCNAVSIAAGVRNSAHPLISHLTRFEARRQPFEHTVHLSNIPKTKNPVFIIYDPTLEMDRIMVEQWCMPAYPDAKILSIPHGGHPPLQMLQELGQLKSTIISIVETGNYGIKDIPYESSSIYWLNKANYEYRIQAFVDCKHSCLQGLSIQNPKSAAKLQYLLEKLDQKEDTSNLTLNIEPACMKT